MTHLQLKKIFKIKESTEVSFVLGKPFYSKMHSGLLETSRYEDCFISMEIIQLNVLRFVRMKLCSTSLPCISAYCYNLLIISAQKIFCSSAKTCMLPASTGTCFGYFQSWFFNARIRKCQKFIYGGCDGNDNRFETLQSCQRLCGNYKGRPTHRHLQLQIVSWKG